MGTSVEERSLCGVPRPALPLYEGAPTRWGTTQMAYAGMADDTEPLRRAELERMAE